MPDSSLDWAVLGGRVLFSAAVILGSGLALLFERERHFLEGKCEVLKNVVKLLLRKDATEGDK